MGSAVENSSGSSNGGQTAEEADLLDRSVKRAKKVVDRGGSGNESGEKRCNINAETDSRPPALRDVLLGNRRKPKADGLRTDLFLRIDDRVMVDFSNSLGPEILITDVELENFRANWTGSLMLKVLGKRVSCGVLMRRLMQIWVTKGELTLIDLPNDYFIVKFTASEDINFALSGGPWLVKGLHLTIRDGNQIFIGGKHRR